MMVLQLISTEVRAVNDSVPFIHIESNSESVNYEAEITIEYDAIRSPRSHFRVPRGRQNIPGVNKNNQRTFLQNRFFVRKKVSKP